MFRPVLHTHLLVPTSHATNLIHTHYNQLDGSTHKQVSTRSNVQAY